MWIVSSTARVAASLPGFTIACFRALCIGSSTPKSHGFTMTAQDCCILHAFLPRHMPPCESRLVLLNPATHRPHSRQPYIHASLMFITISHASPYIYSHFTFYPCKLFVYPRRLILSACIPGFSVTCCNNRNPLWPAMCRCWTAASTESVRSGFKNRDKGPFK